MKMAPPIRGVHRHANKQVLYENIHKFLTHREWGELDQDEGVSGITWVELFALFDTTEARTPNGRHLEKT